MSNEYLPLAEHLKGEGLKEGTVLNAQDEADSETYTWTVNGLYSNQDQKVTTFNPFYNILWRIVSTPPKKITFEAKDGFSRVMGVDSLCLPHDHPFVEEAPLIVTVEEKR